MTEERICANDTALPTEKINDIHDCLVLALDATDGQRVQRTSLTEARSYMRAALRDTSSMIEGIAQ
ncbi:MAG: hypothetical protein KUG74_15515 [Rhodobacteraceae bacterium]|nr:hypothetical protein [Paracoccaceae bacterium]